jgi:uncharacterized surface protein with fasciclin (FAS1) repeats
VNRKSILLLVTLLVLGLTSSAGVVAAQGETPGTVYDVIESDARLESFETLVKAAALDDNLAQDGPFTVFAPTNEAWAAFEAMEAETGTTMTQILLYHVTNGEYTVSRLAEHKTLSTLSEERLLFNVKDETIVLNDTTEVITTDIRASNGVVHIIDTVMTLPEGHSLLASKLGSPEDAIAQVLAEDGRFETFLWLSEQAGLMEQLENRGVNYTLFAPTDEAFAAVPQELMEKWMSDPQGELKTVLSYHLVGDQLGINQIATDNYIPTLEGRPLIVATDEEVRVYVNGRPIQSFNILAANGVIHVVNEVLMP